MKAQITIAMDNAAFGDDSDHELVRILRKVADTIESRGLDFASGRALMDFNGNKVGTLEIQD